MCFVPGGNSHLALYLNNGVAMKPNKITVTIDPSGTTRMTQGTQQITIDSKQLLEFAQHLQDLAHRRVRELVDKINSMDELTAVVCGKNIEVYHIDTPQHPIYQITSQGQIMFLEHSSCVRPDVVIAVAEYIQAGAV